MSKASYEPITVTLTRAKVCEAVAEALNSVEDWKCVAVATIAYRVAERLGFGKADK